MNGLKKLLVYGLLFAAASFVVAWLYLFYSYSQSLPKVPQPEAGRTYSLNNHGSVVYLTKDEDSRLTYLCGIAFLSAIAGGALGKH